MYYKIDTKALKEMADKAAVKEAEARANNLKENYPDWKDKLPDCPCTQEEIDKSDLFERNDYGLETHHPGAASGYRSSEPVEIKSSVNPELPKLEAGQQCTFDRNGDVITRGEGAGTPDAFSPSEATNVLEHYQTDVFPSRNMSTKEYHQEWTPNNGNKCPENWGDKVTKPELENDRPDESEANLENQRSEVESSQESDRNSTKSFENPQTEAEINPNANIESDAESETKTEESEFESFMDETSGEDNESFLESDSGEVESFAEASSESFESFAESSSGSFESFSESGAEMTGESSSELVAEMG